MFPGLVQCYVLQCHLGGCSTTCFGAMLLVLVQCYFVGSVLLVKTHCYDVGASCLAGALFPGCLQSYLEWCNVTWVDTELFGLLQCYLSNFTVT
jgi:hypothetical protein